MKQKPRKLFSAQVIRTLLHLALITVSVILVIGFISYMQRQFAVRTANHSSGAALDAIVETLNTNTEKVNVLCERYHTDNRTVLTDMAYLLQSPRYTAALHVDDEQRSQIMARLSQAIGTSGHLFVIDKQGSIVVAPEQSAIGQNLMGNGTLTSEQLSALLDGSSAEGVLATPAGSDTKAYFYSLQVSDDYWLAYAEDSIQLETQLQALRDLRPVLSGVVLEGNGFIFAVDAQTECFTYYDDGNQVLSGQPIAQSGLTKDILKNRYSGLQTIEGTKYQCVSRTYSSPFYGQYTVITAVSAAESVFAGNTVVIAVTAIIFILCALIILLYSSLLHMDPEQLAYYDEDILSRFSVRQVRRKRHTQPVRNAKVFHVFGTQIYMKIGIAERLSPVILICLAVVFGVSWNAQMLTELTRGMEQASTAVKQMDTLFSNRDNSSDILMQSYQEQYLSKLQLISFILEEDRSWMEPLGNMQDDHVYTYTDTSLQPITDAHGRPVRSVAFSRQLISLAKENGFDYLAVYDDQGRTIAASSDMWYFVLSRDGSSQSAPFLDVIAGRRQNLVQEAMIDDNGHRMQYLGTAIKCYTLEGDGPDAGTCVSSDDYNRFLRDGVIQVNGVDYSVVRRRMLVQGGISDQTIMDIMESTTDKALMNQLRIGHDGRAILFDNSSEHVCLWSPDQSNIGRTASELGISGSAFSGTFMDFARMGGVDYFRAFRFDQGHWIAICIPSSTLLVGRDIIALITTLVAFVLYLLLFVLSIFSTEEEEDLLVKSLEKRIKQRGDNGMVKVEMPNGRIKYVRSASARFSGSQVEWKDMTANQRLGIVLRALCGCIVLIVVLSLLMSSQLFGVESAVNYIVHGDWQHSFNYFAVTAFMVVIMCVSVISFMISGLINLLIRNMGSRVETVGRLLLSVIKYGSVLFSIFYGLSLLGFSTSGLVTSASIMSIVIGLGSQSLINDILSGIFIVFEGAFRVGDIVTVGDFRGSVVDIGLRTTKIENVSGDIKIFNNSGIAGIINMTKKNSKAVCDISIEYGADLKKIEGILGKELPKLAKANPMILGGPMYLGVTELADSAVVLRLVADCTERDRLSVTRYLNRQLFLLFREYGINIPFPQMTVSYLPEEGEQTDETTLDKEEQ